jgi:hypothetical protein
MLGLKVPMETYQKHQDGNTNKGCAERLSQVPQFGLWRGRVGCVWGV